jgi:hypothetical protein
VTGPTRAPAGSRNRYGSHGSSARSSQPACGTTRFVGTGHYCSCRFSPQRLAPRCRSTGLMARTSRTWCPLTDWTTPGCPKWDPIPTWRRRHHRWRGHPGRARRAQRQGHDRDPAVAADRSPRPADPPRPPPDPAAAARPRPVPGGPGPAPRTARPRLTCASRAPAPRHRPRPAIPDPKKDPPNRRTRRPLPGYQHARYRKSCRTKIIYRGRTPPTALFAESGQSGRVPVLRSRRTGSCGMPRRGRESSARRPGAGAASGSGAATGRGSLPALPGPGRRAARHPARRGHRPAGRRLGDQLPATAVLYEIARSGCRGSCAMRSPVGPAARPCWSR